MSILLYFEFACLLAMRSCSQEKPIWLVSSPPSFVNATRLSLAGITAPDCNGQSKSMHDADIPVTASKREFPPETVHAFSLCTQPRVTRTFLPDQKFASRLLEVSSRLINEFPPHIFLKLPTRFAQCLRKK